MVDKKLFIKEITILIAMVVIGISVAIASFFICIKIIIPFNIAVNYAILLSGFCIAVLVAFVQGYFYACKEKKMSEDIRNNVDKIEFIKRYKLHKPREKDIDMFYITKKSSKISIFLNVLLGINIVMLAGVLLISHLLNIQLVSGIVLFVVGAIVIFVVHFMLYEKNELCKKYYVRTTEEKDNTVETHDKYFVLWLLSYFIGAIIIAVVNMFFHTQLAILLSILYLTAFSISYISYKKITRKGDLR